MVHISEDLLSCFETSKNKVYCFWIGKLGHYFVLLAKVIDMQEDHNRIFASEENCTLMDEVEKITRLLTVLLNFPMNEIVYG